MPLKIWGIPWVWTTETVQIAYYSVPWQFTRDPFYLLCRLHVKSMANDSSRAITLTKNSQFYVRQGDVERLIQQGYLQRLT